MQQNYYLEKEGYEFEPVKKSGNYINAYGNKIFGAHQYMLQTGWCVLTEVDYNEFHSKFVNEKIRENIIWFCIFILVFFILIFSVIKLIKLENGS